MCTSSFTEGQNSTQAIWNSFLKGSNEHTIIDPKRTAERCSMLVILTLNVICNCSLFYNLTDLRHIMIYSKRWRLTQCGTNSNWFCLVSAFLCWPSQSSWWRFLFICMFLQVCMFFLQVPPALCSYLLKVFISGNRNVKYKIW